MMQSESIEITSIDKLIDAAELVYKKLDGTAWWRGQGMDYQLLPMVYRTQQWADAEQTQMFRFITAARSRHHGCPAQMDHTAWLFLMRHYGFPTRLLDWSASPLVAAFFGTFVREEAESPGVLWALDPLALNASQGQKIIFAAESRDALEVINPAFRQGHPPCPKTLAIAPSEADVRMMVQSSMFTVHGRPIPLEELPGAEGFLYRFNIPASAKVALFDQLFILGVRRQLLLPDLTNLGIALMEQLGEPS
jgi:hypothetical protein